MSKEQIERNEKQRIRLEHLLDCIHKLLPKDGDNTALFSLLAQTELALAINGATDKLYDIKEEIFHVQLGIRESA